MNFKDLLKNPSEVIWREIDKKRGVKPEHPTSQVGLPPKPSEPKDSLSNAITSKDWSWILRGKTGLALKIGIPTILLFTLINGLVQRPEVKPVESPDVVDTGDTLETPPYQSVNYITAAKSNGKSLLFSPALDSVNEIGVRGLVLSENSVDSSIDYYFPISNTDYAYIKDGDLKMYYRQINIVRKGGRDIEEVEEADNTILTNINASDLENAHITEEGLFAFSIDSTFYVYTKKGEELEKYDYSQKPNTSLYTYLAGEIYYIDTQASIAITEDSTSTANVSSENFMQDLVKLNKNKEEIYRQPLGENPVHRYYVLNSDRFLFVFEEPTEKTFFFIQMRDSAQRNLFGFAPQEEVQKQVRVDLVYFISESNTVFTLGGGVAKLYTNTGKQLWIN
jgi:hypothetical protein